MKARLTLLAAAFCSAALGVQAGTASLPEFQSEAELDTWLRAHSLRFRTLVRRVEMTGGYKVEPSDQVEQGLATHEGRTQKILLNPKLTGARRASVLIFELTNAYSDAAHRRVDADARVDRIRTHEEFGRRHELIEYAGLVLHRSVLAELDREIAIHPEWFTWVTPGPTSFAKYRVPRQRDYLEAQKRTWHTAHYYRWFYLQRGEQPPAGL